MARSFNFSSLEFGADRLPDFGTRKEKEFIRKARLKHRPVAYKNAQQMARDINIAQDYFSLVSGSFIYGDFIEAICEIHDLHPEKVLITTLGMSANNIDSIVNLVDYLGAGAVGLVVSTYFYGTERRNLIPYMVQEFSGKPIGVAVCASHTKICLIESEKTRLVMYGSANLSSSGNLEEFTITHDAGIYDFCDRTITKILRNFKIINGLTGETRFEKMRNRGKDLFETLTTQETEEK